MQSGNQDPQMSHLNLIKAMWKAVRGSRNPEKLIEMMAQNNPDLKSVLSLVGSNDPKEVFYNHARRMGLTDEQISAYLKELAE